MRNGSFCTRIGLPHRILAAEELLGDSRPNDTDIRGHVHVALGKYAAFSDGPVANLKVGRPGTPFARVNQFRLPLTT